MRGMTLGTWTKTVYYRWLSWLCRTIVVPLVIHVGWPSDTLLASHRNSRRNCDSRQRYPVIVHDEMVASDTIINGVDEICKSGANWAWYNPLASCNPSRLTLSFDARSMDGILLYSGPRNVPVADGSGGSGGGAVASDYVAIELQQGRPVLYLNLGAETTKLQFGQFNFSFLLFFFFFFFSNK